MQSLPLVTSSNRVVQVKLIEENQAADWLKQQDSFIQNFCQANNFKAKAGQWLLLPEQESGKAAQLLATFHKDNFWQWGDWVHAWPAADYQVDWGELDAYLPILAWCLGSYSYTEYLSVAPKMGPRLLCAEPLKATLESEAAAIFLVRDWINQPAQDMHPEALEIKLQDLAQSNNAEFSVIKGSKLQAEYPAIHAVGKAGEVAPRLLHLSWGDAKHPRLALVGKGVCFDSGGLNLKPTAGMRWMKKDMAGAAHVAALAKLIMERNLPIALDVWIPAVENAVASQAYRPGDIIRTASGLTVEVGNTDAEGRLILAEALTAAQGKNPKCIIDFSTLTGAGRVALGTDIPASFIQDDTFAQQLQAASDSVKDPLWRMPLYQPYADLIKSPFADLQNDAKIPYAGAITAALFLQAFIEDRQLPWLHLDLMAWNLSSRAGRPQGGEAMALRAVWQWCQTWAA
jgi:leucyl aminopeptidase